MELAGTTKKQRNKKGMGKRETGKQRREMDGRKGNNIFSVIYEMEVISVLQVLRQNANLPMNLSQERARHQESTLGHNPSLNQ